MIMPHWTLYVRRAMVNTHISWWRRRRLEEFPTAELPDQMAADHGRGYCQAPPRYVRIDHGPPYIKRPVRH
ncbi:MAG: hypothetical protein ACLPV4_06035, partial [Solirubrobacteraceae bacterium]